jgi:hypothetical protein
MMKKLKQLGFFSYGEVIPGLKLYGKPAPYPVLNERSVRAGAGIMFVLGLFAFFQAFFLREFTYINIIVVIFFIDFFIKVVLGSKFSPITIIGDFLVRGQEPEYVGAIQKRFAWTIGLVLSVIMMTLIFGFSVMGPFNLVICILCLVFMFLESVVGVCVGCKIYNYLLAAKIIPQPEYKPVCPGNVCSID